MIDAGRDAPAASRRGEEGRPLSRPFPTKTQIAEKVMAKKIVNIRLRPDQEERIFAIVERSAILDTSKFMRMEVDWLLMSDIGEVIKRIVDAEAFPDYAMPNKTRGRKSRVKKNASNKPTRLLRNFVAGRASR